MTKSGPSTTSIVLGMVCGLLAVAVFGLAVWAQDPQQNTIQIYTVPGKGVAPPTMNFVVTTRMGFAVRNEVVMLDVGGKEFTQSRSPEDGSLNTLIFPMSLAQFNALTKEGNTDVDIVVRYGKSGVGERLYFGKLSKALLNKK